MWRTGTSGMASVHNGRGSFQAGDLSSRASSAGSRRSSTGSFRKPSTVRSARGNGGIGESRNRIPTSTLHEARGSNTAVGDRRPSVNGRSAAVSTTHWAAHGGSIGFALESGSRRSSFKASSRSAALPTGSVLCVDLGYPSSVGSFAARTNSHTNDSPLRGRGGQPAWVERLSSPKRSVSVASSGSSFHNKPVYNQAFLHDGARTAPRSQLNTPRSRQLSPRASFSRRPSAERERVNVGAFPQETAAALKGRGASCDALSAGQWTTSMAGSSHKKSSSMRGEVSGRTISPQGADVDGQGFWNSPAPCDRLHTDRSSFGRSSVRRGSAFSCPRTESTYVDPLSEVPPQQLDRLRGLPHAEYRPAGASRLDFSKEEDLKEMFRQQHTVDPLLHTRPNKRLFSIPDHLNLFGTHGLASKKTNLASHTPRRTGRMIPPQREGVVKEQATTLADFLNGGGEVKVRGRGTPTNRGVRQDKLDIFSWSTGQPFDHAGPPSVSPRRGRAPYHAAQQSSLGVDMHPTTTAKVLDSPQRQQRTCTRSLSAIDRQFNQQPQNVRPPKKVCSRMTDEVREMGAAHDNDIFGVSARVAEMVQASALRHTSSKATAEGTLHRDMVSTVPFGVDDDDARWVHPAASARQWAQTDGSSHSNEPFAEMGACAPATPVGPPPVVPPLSLPQAPLEVPRAGRKTVLATQELSRLQTPRSARSGTLKPKDSFVLGSLTFDHEAGEDLPLRHKGAATRPAMPSPRPLVTGQRSARLQQNSSQMHDIFHWQ